MNPPHKLRAEARARDPIIFREDRPLLAARTPVKLDRVPTEDWKIDRAVTKV